MVVIREEIETDHSAVHEVIKAAFEGEAEAKLVNKLRNSEHISLVALVEDKLVGHICFSPMRIEGSDDLNCWGLAPLSVHPDFQNQGIGMKLTEAGLKACSKKSIDAVFVLGHPNYYPRFGFETAKKFGFTSEYAVPDEHFMVLELKKGSLKGRSGLAKYSPAFSDF